MFALRNIERFVMLHFTSTANKQSTHAVIAITYSVKPQLFCGHPILIPHEVFKYIESAFSQITFNIIAYLIRLCTSIQYLVNVSLSVNALSVAIRVIL